MLLSEKFQLSMLRIYQEGDRMHQQIKESVQILKEYVQTFDSIVPENNVYQIIRTQTSGRYNRNIIMGHVIVLKAKGNKMADCLQCNLLLTLVVHVGYIVYSHGFNVAHLLSGGSVARGHPQHGKPVHVRDLHRDEEPALPRPSV